LDAVWRPSLAGSGIFHRRSPYLVHRIDESRQAVSEKVWWQGFGCKHAARIGPDWL